MDAPTPDPEESTVFKSTPFGKYTLLRKLGKGGMGIVYEALDTVLNRRVAVKLLVPSSDGGGESRDEQDRFLREARLSAALPKHPHIVSVYEAGVIDGRQFLAMEFIEGQQFGAWRIGHPVREQVALLRDIALAVQHAHDHGVIHRDLKPANILVDGRGRPHVTDFGLAKSHVKELDRSITTSGVVVGTPAYMSPEQAQGLKSIDGRSDVFTLGTILYEVLTGHMPFEAETAMQVLVAVIEHPAPLPSQVAAALGLAPVDAGLESVCLTALAKSPEKRYPGAAAFAQALSLWLEKPEPPVPHPVPARRPWATLAVLALLLAGFITYAALPAGPPAAAPWPVIEGHDGRVMGVVFTPDGKRLLSGGSDGTVRIWDLEHKRQLGALGPLNGKIESLALSSDGLAVAAVTEDEDDGDAPGEAVIWELADGKVRVRLDGHDTGLNAVAFSRDGRVLATGDKRGMLRLWDAATGALRLEKKAHEQPIRSIAFGPQGGFATASWDHSVRLWGPDGAARGTLKGFKQGIWGVAVSPDGLKVATADSEKKVRLWTLAKPDQPRLLGTHEKEAVCVAFSADGRRVASGGWDRVARVWDAEGGGEVASFAGHTDFVWGLAWSPDGRLLASAGLDGKVRLWLLPR